MLSNQLYSQSPKRIIWISLGALLLAHSMVNTYVPNEALNFVGLLITTLFVFNSTLRKHDYFSFVMVIYICAPFTYLTSKGGAFNLVAFLCVLLYYINYKKLPFELRNINDNFRHLILVWFVSSVLGWIFNFVGTTTELLYSIFAFTGIVLTVLISGRIVINEARIKDFLKINIVLVFYAAIVVANKAAGGVFPFPTPMMLVGGTENIGGSDLFYTSAYFSSSPMFAQFGVVWVALFTVFLLLGQGLLKFNRSHLTIALFLSFMFVFVTSIRSAFLLSLGVVIVIMITQHRLTRFKLKKSFSQILLVIGLGFFIIYSVDRYNLGFIFTRLDQIGATQEKAGGVTLATIVDGSALNREAAFYEGFRRYHSRDHWFMGYGWGLSANNRHAFFVDTSIARGSAHSQYFAILFLFGWVGFIAFFGLHILIMKRSFVFTGCQEYPPAIRLFALFGLLVPLIFLLDGIKADNVSSSNYFVAAMILLGLSYSNTKAPLAR